MSDYAVFCGLDVGKAEHHGVALDPDGKPVFDRPLGNDERALRALFSTLSSRGPIVVVVDQPRPVSGRCTGQHDGPPAGKPLWPTMKSQHTTDRRLFT